MTDEAKDLPAERGNFALFQREDDESDLNLPEYMREDKGEGAEKLGEFLRPGRLKIIQRNAEPQFLELFDPGDAVVTPQNLTLAPIKKTDTGKPSDEGEPFAFTPLLFIPEWIVTNPIAYKGSEPFVRDRTLDKTHEIARKAQSSSTWREPHPEKPQDNDGTPQYIRYVECLNFIVLAAVDGFRGMPLLLSLAKTNHRVGSNLAGLIKMRRGPIFGMVFEAKVVHRTNTQGNWYGWQVQNPSDTGAPPWLPEDQFARSKTMHEELKSKTIDLVYDEEDVGDSPTGKEKF